jgi:hypothetical protein
VLAEPVQRFPRIVADFGIAHRNCARSKSAYFRARKAVSKHMTILKNRIGNIQIRQDNYRVLYSVTRALLVQ